MKSFKPMLASPADLDNIRYPVFASPKLDGIRASVVGGKLLSRTLKEIPSRWIFGLFSKSEFEGLDGELIVGEPTHPDCYRTTVSGVMSVDSSPNVTYHVFDCFIDPSAPFRARRVLADMKATHVRMERLQHATLHNRHDLDTYEAQQVELGYEGIMLADPNGKYKFGRATTKGGELLKVKRFVDSEAVVVGIEEEMFNGNEAQTNELGRTKRSTAKAGLVGKGTMGALIVQDVKTGVEFNIGTGFTAEDRKQLWKNPPIGHTVKFKHFPVGAKIAPRHPVFLGFRPEGA